MKITSQTWISWDIITIPIIANALWVRYGIRIYNPPVTGRWKTVQLETPYSEAGFVVAHSKNETTNLWEMWWTILKMTRALEKGYFLSNRVTLSYMWNCRSEVFLLSLCSFCPLNSWLHPVLTHKNVREPKGLRHVRSKLLTVTFIDSLDSLAPSIIPFFWEDSRGPSITCLFWRGAVNISAPHPSQIVQATYCWITSQSITTVSTFFWGGLCAFSGEQLQPQR